MIQYDEERRPAGTAAPQPTGAGPAVAEGRPGTEQTAQQARRQSAGAAEAVRDRAGDVAKSQKNRAAHRIGDVGGALDRAADKLQSEEDQQLADYMRKAANSLRSFASSLEDKDLGALKAQVEDAARSRPTLFLGAAFIGGLAAARFLRSKPPQEWEEPAEPMPTGLEEPGAPGEVVTAYSSTEQGTVVEETVDTEPSGGPQGSV